MFGKSKVSQSMIDAVLKVTESSKEEVTEAQQLDEANWEKEKTATGVKVYGSSYGNSAKAKKDQTKSAVDTLKGPKDKEVKEGYFSKQLVQSISEEEKIEKQINEVLSKDASAGAWIHDFVHSDNPKFSGKSKAKRKKMALAAYYAKQRNEEVEKEKSDEKSDHDKWKEAYKKARDAGSSSSNAKARANGAVYEETELSEAKVTTTDENPDRVTTDDLTGREEGGKSNSFKAFKLKLKTDGEMKAPTEEKPEDTKARTSVKPGESHVEVKPATIHAKEEIELSEGGFKRIATDREEDARLGTSPKKGTDVADKSWLKDAGKKPGALHNVGKGLKAFLKGKPEPMESVEVEGEKLEEVYQQDDTAPITTDTLAGRMPGGKMNSFKSFKTRVKPTDKEGDGEPKSADCGCDAEETPARKSIGSI